MLCHVIDSGSTAYTHLLSGYYCLAHILYFLAFSCYRCMYLTIRAYSIIIMIHFNEILQSDWSLERFKSLITCNLTYYTPEGSSCNWHDNIIRTINTVHFLHIKYSLLDAEYNIFPYCTPHIHIIKV